MRNQIAYLCCFWEFLDNFLTLLMIFFLEFLIIIQAVTFK